MQGIRLQWLCICLLTVACGPEPTVDASVEDSGVDADVGIDASDAELPDAAPDADDAETMDVSEPDRCVGPPGMFTDEFCQELAADLLFYQPRYQLWSDDSTKERYVRLPAGFIVNTTPSIAEADNPQAYPGPNAWELPNGTQFYKNFLVDGRVVETRVMTKEADGTWSYQTYAWNETRTAVEEIVADGRRNVLGTDHDIPYEAQCIQCHRNAGTDEALGFSAIQLNHAFSEGLNLRTLVREGALSQQAFWEDLIVDGLADVPGCNGETGCDETATQEALGYLHGNCGYCHGGTSPQANQRLWVNLGLSSYREAFVFSSIGTEGLPLSFPEEPVGVSCRIQPGDAEQSTVYRRMTSRMLSLQMPPIGTEAVHREGSEAVRRWINSLSEIADLPACSSASGPAEPGAD